MTEPSAVLENAVQKQQHKRGEPRARARLRAKRYPTWKELHAAVIAWCRSEALRLNPKFDVADFERQARQWARIDDEPVRIWKALQTALEQAEAFLVANPDSPSRSAHAAMLDGFLSSKIEGNDGNFTKSVGERIEYWRNGHRAPPLTSLRARLALLFDAGPNPIWPDKKPGVREIAVLSLLAGCIPEGEKRRQEQAVGEADRPTIADVLDAEQTAVRTTLGRLQRQRTKRSR